MGGISGAFLLLPFQVSVLGFVSPAVSATNQLYNIIATPGGVYRYFKEGRMIWPLAAAVIGGTVPGVVAGTLIRVEYLPDPGHFKLFAAAVLLYIGLGLIRNLLFRHGDKKDSAENNKMPRSSDISDLRRRVVICGRQGMFRIRFDFHGDTFEVPIYGIVVLCLLVGIVGGAYGIGGGSIVAPLFVTFFGLPVYVVAGPALLGTFITSVISVVTFQIIASFYPHMAVAPDWILGLLFGAGGFAGIYCGARMQKFVPARSIKWILAFCVLVPAIRYLFE